MVGSTPKLLAEDAVRSAAGPGLRIHVHDDGSVLDGMLALVELARRPGLLEDTLCAMCRQVAEIANADVVSVYLREPRETGDVLVMLGNVGFPAHAVGHVELGLFDGLTGVVAQRRRPVTVAVAQDDERYKHVDGIGEEQFPAYLGVPLLHRDEVGGVLVLQRRRPFMFTPSDVTLASSLTAPFIFVIERDGTSRIPARSTFVGAPLVDGRAVGAATVLPARSAASSLSEPAVLQALELDLVTATQRLGHLRAPQVTRALGNLGLLVIALRERTPDAVLREDVLLALERMPYRTMSGDKELGTLLAERHTELFDLWAFLVADLSLRGGVLVTRHLGVFLALEAVARGAAAVVVSDAIEPDASEVLRAGGVPAVTGVAELATALRGGEILEVDATRGSVRIVERHA